MSARLLFIGMLNFADDNGNLAYSAKRLKMQIFPADNLDVQPLINQLLAHGVLIEYENNSNKYIHIKGFKRHQVINRPSKSSIPDIDFNEDSVSPQVQHTESSLTEGKGREEERNTVTNVTGEKSPLSPDQIIFGYGLPMLTNSGTAEKQARSFLGGLRKHHGDAAVVDALRNCIREKPMQPLEWLAAALPPSGAKAKTNKQMDLEQRNKAVVASWLRNQEASNAVV